MWIAYWRQILNNMFSFYCLKNCPDACWIVNLVVWCTWNIPIWGYRPRKLLLWTYPQNWTTRCFGDFDVTRDAIWEYLYGRQKACLQQILNCYIAHWSFRDLGDSKNNPSNTCGKPVILWIYHVLVLNSICNHELSHGESQIPGKIFFQYTANILIGIHIGIDVVCINWFSYYSSCGMHD